MPKTAVLTADAKAAKRKAFRKHLKRYWVLYAMLVLPVAYYIVFKYVPMVGNVLAFRRYRPGKGPFGTEWTLRYFDRFLRDPMFWRALRNTLVLSIGNILINFPIPILFAILLNEVRAKKFKTFVQTVSYMPRFISTVVVAGMVISFIDNQGLVTNFLTLFGFERQNYRINPDAFPATYTITNVWKGFGFGSILYFSTISSIDQGLYESAKLDGANRFQQVLHITLPGIKHVIAINLIMAIGGILNTNSELILLLYTEATYNVADVIGTYTYRLGIVGGQYSYTTAAGLFMSVIGFILTYTANKVSNRLTGMGLW